MGVDGGRLGSNAGTNHAFGRGSNSTEERVHLGGFCLGLLVDNRIRIRRASCSPRKLLPGQNWPRAIETQYIDLSPYWAREILRLVAMMRCQVARRRPGTIELHLRIRYENSGLRDCGRKAQFRENGAYSG
jgi:hypothetical protein